MNANDVMTKNVITVAPDTKISECAGVLLEHKISAVPVVDDERRVLGIVSEGDLIRRVELGTERPGRSWWLRLLTDNSALASDYVKSHSKYVRDVMTSNVTTVDSATPLNVIAEILESKHIKRVPVLDNDRLVGIVSRANLLQGLAAARDGAANVPSTDDRAIRAQLVEALDKEPWSTSSSMNITVSSGVVEVWGTVGSQEERRALRVAAENTPGVRDVIDHSILASAVPSGI